MLVRYKVPMPNQNLSDAEVREYIAYFKWADANLRPEVAMAGMKAIVPDSPGAQFPHVPFSRYPAAIPDWLGVR